VTKLQLLVAVGLCGVAAAALAIAGSAAAGEHAARSAAQEICAWERGTEPETELAQKLGMGRGGRSFLLDLRDQKLAIECLVTSSSYSDSLGERAVTLRVHGRDVVHFRVAPRLSGPRVIGYWSPAP
jgi:hypothetical protein